MDLILIRFAFDWDSDLDLDFDFDSACFWLDLDSILLGFGLISTRFGWLWAWVGPPGAS